MNQFTIRRGNYEVVVSALGALRPVEVGEDVGAIISRGLLHYDKEISKLVVEKQGSGKDAKLVDIAWSAEAQAAVELRLEAALGTIFSGVKIAAAKRVKSVKVDVGAAVAAALRAAGLSEDAVKAAMVAQGHSYTALATAEAQPQAPASEGEMA